MRHLTPEEIQRSAEARDASRPECDRGRGEDEALGAVLARLDGLGRHGPATGFADGVVRRLDVAGAALDRELDRLRGWAPTPGFATAVLARVRLPVPWPERLLRFLRRRRVALATTGAATLAVSSGGAAWLFGAQGFAPGQLLALATAGARTVLLEAALAAGRLGYRFGLVDAGGSILDRISPAVAVTSLALSSVIGMASLWVMATLFRRPGARLVRVRRPVAAGLLTMLLATFPGALPVRAQEAETADAAHGPASLQIVPGGLGFDVADRLEGLRDALRRLGVRGESIGDDLVLIVHEDHGIAADRTVPGDIAILGGTLRLAGAVEGDVLLLDGTLEMDDGARVGGNVLRVGGDIDLGEGTAAIMGEILSDVVLAPSEPGEGGAPAASAAPEARGVAGGVAAPVQQQPRRPGAVSRFARNVSTAAEDLGEVIAAFIGLGALGLVLVYFARRRLETIADTVRREFARSMAMGIAGQILFLPACLVLLAAIITWPILPFFLLCTGLAGLAGYIAAAHGAGEMFARRRLGYRWMEALRRPNSYYYVTSGLALLLLPFALGAVLRVFGGAADLLRGLLMFVAGLGTWVLVTAGFGGVLLTRGGDRSVVVAWSGAEASPDVAPDAPEASAFGADTDAEEQP